MKLFFILGILFFTVGAQASHRIGFGAGTPWVAEASYEYWGPVVVRAHAGTIGLASSAALDFGLPIDDEGDFKQFVGVSAEGAASIWFYGLGMVDYGGGGPKYGFRYKGLYADAGLGIGGGESSFLNFPIFSGLAVFPMVHVGYAFAL